MIAHSISLPTRKCSASGNGFDSLMLVHSSGGAAPQTNPGPAVPCNLWDRLPPRFFPGPADAITNVMQSGRHCDQDAPGHSAATRARANMIARRNSRREAARCGQRSLERQLETPRHPTPAGICNGFVRSGRSPGRARQHRSSAVSSSESPDRPPRPPDRPGPFQPCGRVAPILGNQNRRSSHQTGSSAEMAAGEVLAPAKAALLANESSQRQKLMMWHAGSEPKALT
jgi:hypothetical protein